MSLVVRASLVVVLVGCAASWHEREAERLGLGRKEFGRVKALIVGGRVIEAKQMLAEMPSSLRESAAWHYLMGRVLMAAGEFSEAVDELTEARKRYFGSPVIENDLGVALVRAGRGKEAVAILDALASRFPEDRNLAMNRAVARLAGGATDEAVEALEGLVSLDERWFEANYNLGLAALARGDYARAIWVLKRALTIRPGDRDALLALARACTLIEDSWCAAQAVQEALSRYSTDPIVLVAYGLHLEARGELEGAIEHIGKATVLDPGCSVCFCNYGRLLEGRGEKAAAREAFRRCIENARPGEDVSLVRMHLKALE